MEISFQTLITPILTAIGALFAAWFGTYLGLRKFRKERSFDARLEWHRKLAETSRVLLNRTRAFNTFTKGKTPEDAILPLINELGKLAFDFQEQSELTSLYATKSTNSAITNVLSQMTEAAKPYANYSESEKNATKEDSINMLKGSVNGIQQVYDLLSKDIRKMLGLKKI